MAQDYIDLPNSLIYALIQQESGWNPKAVNKKSGAVGLGQIMPPALADYNQYNTQKYTMRDMYDAQKNSEVTSWYLYNRIPSMLNTYKIPVTIDNVLASYNFGIGNVKKGKALPKETINYIANIKRNLEMAKGGNLFGGQTAFRGKGR